MNDEDSIHDVAEEVNVEDDKAAEDDITMRRVLKTLRIARDDHDDDEVDDDDDVEENAFHLLRHSCCKVVSVLCSLSIHNQTSTHIPSCRHGIKS